MNGCSVPFLVLVSLVTTARSEYVCYCTYNVETSVYPSPNAEGPVRGYMYEFDCKPFFPGVTNPQGIIAVQFEKQIGYIKKDSQTMEQMCPGDPPNEDLVETTERASTTTTTESIQVTPAVKPKTSSVTKPSTTEHTSSTRIGLSEQTSPTTISEQTSPTTISEQTSPAAIFEQTSPTTISEKSSPTTISEQTSPTGITGQTSFWGTTVLKQTLSTSQPSNTVYSFQTTDTPKPTSYLATVSGTPLQYIGIGYNLLDGNPDGDMTSQHHPDPGLLFNKRIFQMTEGPDHRVQEATLNMNQTCLHSAYTALLNTGYAYQQYLFKSISLSTDLNISPSAFVHNNGFISLQQNFETSPEYVYLEDSSICKLGTARFKTFSAGSNETLIRVTEEFAAAVCNLPVTGNDQMPYLKFIDQWGTNIVMAADVGTKSVGRYRTTVMNIFNDARLKNPDLIQYGGLNQQHSSSIVIDPSAFPVSRLANSLVQHTRASQNFTIGSLSNPLPTHLDLALLSDALNFTYWSQILGKLISRGICPDDVDRQTLRIVQTNLASALAMYSAYRDQQPEAGISQLQGAMIQIPLTWPVGTYTLMQPVSGCPDTTWSQGSRYQNTEKHNQFSSGLVHTLKGTFNSNVIQTYYCTRTVATETPYDGEWPQGDYCILKYKECPAGFADGYIFWDDLNLLVNRNRQTGTLPTGEYDKNTKIYYCCRNDGSASAPVLLPTEHPFVLLRYRSTCQAVHGMTSREEYIHWDDVFAFNSDDYGGAHPLDDRPTNGHTLHFCHYRRTSGGPPIVG